MTSCVLSVLLSMALAPQEFPLPLRLDHEPADRPAAAEEFSLWRVGARFQAWTSSGEPANDMMGGSLYGSYNLKELVHENLWFTVQFTNFSGFDFERPDELLFDIKAPPTVDAVVPMQLLQVTAEWHPLPKDSRFDVYVGAGFGIAFVGDGDAHDLPTSDIELEGETGPELHAVLGAAVRVIGPVYVTVEFSATLQFAGWEATDRVSGRKETFDGWTTMGIGAGLEVRF